MEGFQDHQLPLTITFIDFKKAFDSIDWKINVCCSTALGYTCGCGQRYQCIVHEFEKCSIGRREYFWPLWGYIRVLKGDVLAQFLFVILDYLMRKATSDRLRRYPAKVLNGLDFADDIALLETTMALALLQSVGRLDFGYWFFYALSNSCTSGWNYTHYVRVSGPHKALSARYARVSGQCSTDDLAVRRNHG